MALALNNLKRVYMPLNKEIKPNQTYGDNHYTTGTCMNFTDTRDLFVKG